MGLMKKSATKGTKNVTETIARNGNTSLASQVPKQPPLSSPKTVTELTPQDHFDDLDYGLFEPKKTRNKLTHQAKRSSSNVQQTSSQATIAQSPSQTKPTSPIYRDPKLAEKIQWKLDNLENKYRRMSQMDDFYAAERKYKNQLKNLEVRSAK
jgi:hypothetical protein